LIYYFKAKTVLNKAMSDNTSQEININKGTTSITTQLKELSSLLQSTRTSLDSQSIENDIKNVDVVESLTSSLKDVLYFLKTSLTVMKNAGVDIDFPEEFSGDIVPEDIEFEYEDEDECDEDEGDEDECDEDEGDDTYIVRVDDEIIGYTHSEQDAIDHQAECVDLFLQNYHNTYYYRHERSEDGTSVTYYGIPRNALFRWEQVLFTISYQKIYVLS